MSSLQPKTLLYVLGIAFLPYGLFCFVAPEFLAGAAGVAGTTPTGVTEIRAMYGGLQSALGLLLLVAARDSRLMLGGLAAVAFVLPGLAFTRSLGAVLDGGVSGYTIGALVFEIGSSIVVVSMLRRQLALTPARQPV